MADARWSPVEQETLVKFWADEVVQISLNSMVDNLEVYQGIAVNWHECQTTTKIYYISVHVVVVHLVIVP